MRLYMTVLLCLAAAACSPKPAATSASASSAAPSAAPVVATIPPDQAVFVALPHTLRDKADAATGDEKKKLQSQAPAAFCAEFKKLDTFTGWRAQVKDVRVSTIDGTADIEFDIGRSISLEDIFPKSDPLYATVTALNVGDEVTLSGRFTHLNHDSECTYYFGPFGVAVSKVDKD